MDEVKKKVVGSLVGLAVCDAVGTTVEFMPPGSFDPVEDMQGGGKFDLLPGQWTDDTSMALCLAESLVECQKFNPVDQAKRYWRWYQEGHLSSNGECFDIGKTVRLALHKFERSNETDPVCGSTADGAAGNGSLMRLCPVPLTFYRYPMVAMTMAAESSRTTHGAKAALDACRYFSGLLLGCLQGKDKDTLLSPRFCPETSNYWTENPMVPEVDSIAAGSFKQREPPEIRASGYVVHSLEAVLWAFYHTENFKDGCLKVVNLGGDADTVGAIYGQLAGAYYGVTGIPEEWRAKCSLAPLIEVFALELCQLAERMPLPNLEDYYSTDWSKPYHALVKEKLSSAYKGLKLCGYDLLEKCNKEVVRKLNPCPKAYKMLADFDSEVASITGQYKALPTECQDTVILADFQRRWHEGRKKLELRLNRGRI